LSSFSVPSEFPRFPSAEGRKGESRVLWGDSFSIQTQTPFFSPGFTTLCSRWFFKDLGFLGFHLDPGSIAPPGSGPQTLRFEEGALPFLTTLSPLTLLSSSVPRREL